MMSTRMRSVELEWCSRTQNVLDIYFLNSQNFPKEVMWEAKNKLKFIFYFVLCVCLLASLNVRTLSFPS
jgi:hypothetical protein